MTQPSNDAHNFVQNWLDEIRGWEWGKAYLDTLPPAERKKQAPELLKDEKDRSKEFQAGLAAFRNGAIVHHDPNVFWAPPKVKDNIIGAVKGIFGKGSEAENISLQTVLPIYRRDGEKVTFRFDLMILLPSQYGVQGQLVATANAPNGDPSADDWRIESLDLYSGKSLTFGAPGPGGMPARGPQRPR